LDGYRDVGEDVARQLPTGLDHRQHRLNKAAARIHLDDVTMENGPLKVIPGSHRTGKALTLDLAPPVHILSNRGDVLLMRPLLTHCSGKSHPDTARHRRILHLEFTASEDLPYGYRWHDFIPGIIGSE
jgi:ectoine hydroxylase-related dioxygenase (phytanoyl-CoA dioxygenase family)